MRAVPFDRQDTEGNDGTRCILCVRTPRALLRQSFCSLLGVLLVALIAYSTSKIVSFSGISSTFDGTIDPAVKKKFEQIDHQISDLNRVIRGIGSTARGNVGPRSMGETRSPSPLTAKGASSQTDSQIRGIVKEEILVYDSDKTGLADYALENLGACVVSTRGTESRRDEAASISIFGIPLKTSSSNPRAMLQPHMQPGDCWAFEGPGRAVIKLMTEIVVTSISLEHIPKDITPYGEISSAPKGFCVFGLRSVDDPTPHNFGSFDYSSEGPPLQTFAVENPTEYPYGFVEVCFNSNQGNPDYTCVYRLRVHGYPPKHPGLKRSLS